VKKKITTNSDQERKATGSVKDMIDTLMQNDQASGITYITHVLNKSWSEAEHIWNKLRKLRII
jgi:hypothetical protein